MQLALRLFAHHYFHPRDTGKAAHSFVSSLSAISSLIPARSKSNLCPVLNGEAGRWFARGLLGIRSIMMLVWVVKHSLKYEKSDSKDDARSARQENLQWPEIVRSRVSRCPKEYIQADSKNDQDWQGGD